MLLSKRGVEATWVDPDTSVNAMSTKALSEGDHRIYQLIFSDEFEREGRTFRDGDDPRWTAIHKNDCESSLGGGKLEQKQAFRMEPAEFGRK